MGTCGGKISCFSSVGVWRWVGFSFLTKAACLQGRKIDIACTFLFATVKPGPAAGTLWVTFRIRAPPRVTCSILDGGKTNRAFLLLLKASQHHLWLLSLLRRWASGPASMASKEALAELPPLPLAYCCPGAHLVVGPSECAPLPTQGPTRNTFPNAGSSSYPPPCHPASEFCSILSQPTYLGRNEQTSYLHMGQNKREYWYFVSELNYHQNSKKTQAVLIICFLLKRSTTKWSRESS